MAYAGLSVCAGSLVLPAVLLLRGGAQMQEREDKQMEDGDDGEMNSNQIKLNRLETRVVSVSECDEVEVEVEVERFCSNQDDSYDACEEDIDHFLLPFWRLAQYWCLTVVFVICGITTTGFIESHLVALAVHKGELLSIAALAFSVLSAVNGISMVLVGYLSDVCDRHKLLAAIFFVRSLAYLLLLIPTTNSRAVLFIFASVFGAVDYSVVPVVVSIVRSIAGDSAVGLAVGVLLLWHSLGAAAGASVGGVIFNATGSYTTAIYICAGLCFCSSLICLSMGLSIFKPNNHRRYNNNNNGIAETI
jgi:Na+/melibiose symporter-like transporter